MKCRRAVPSAKNHISKKIIQSGTRKITFINLKTSSGVVSVKSLKKMKKTSEDIMKIPPFPDFGIM